MSKMTLEKFEEIQNTIKNKIQALETDLEHARQQYIQEEIGLSIGDKVKTFYIGKSDGKKHFDVEGTVHTLELESSKTIKVCLNVGNNTLYIPSKEMIIEKVKSPLEQK